MKKNFNEDLLLWTQLKNGSKLALESIYFNHVDGLVQYGCRFTQDTQLIEDVIHDLFVYIWNNKERLSDTDSITNYLLGSLRNNLIRALKKSNTAQLVDDFALIKVEHESNIEQIIISNESQTDQNLQLQKAMETLSSRQKEAIYLRYYEGKEYEEICSIMEINYQSVRNLISTGLKSLKENV